MEIVAIFLLFICLGLIYHFNSIPDYYYTYNSLDSNELQIEYKKIWERNLNIFEKRYGDLELELEYDENLKRLVAIKYIDKRRLKI